MLNPYTPGAGTPPRALIGRGSQLALVRDLADQVEAGRAPNPIIFTGLRGVGKTSLLYEVRDELRARGWLAGYYEVRRDVEPGVAVRAIVQDSAGLARGALREALSSGAHAIGGLRLTAGPSGLAFQVDARAGDASDRDPYAELVAFLSRLGQDARRSGLGVALLVDELQVFRKRDVSVLVQALSALKDQPVALLGAGLPYLAGELSGANTYAERFRYEQIDRLDEADARSAVVDPAFDQGTTWAADALDRIVALAAGYPYFLQLYASESWIAAGGAARITLGHVEASVPSVRRQLDAGLYSARFARLSQREREYVEAMVAVADQHPDGGRVDLPVGSGAVAEHLSLTLAQASTTRARVIRKGVVHAPTHGELAFSVPGFADYVRRRAGE